MWKLLAKLLKGGKKWLRKKVKAKTIGAAKTGIKAPIKFLRNPAKYLKTQFVIAIKKPYVIYKKVTGTINLVKRIFPTSRRTKLIIDLANKSRLLEQVLEMGDYMLRNSNANIEISEIIKDINANHDLLKIKTTDELENLRDMFDKQLKEAGFDIEKDLTDLPKKEIEAKALELVYDKHLDEWEKQFLDSDVEDPETGEIMTEERKQEIMGHIREDFTIEAFEKAKNIKGRQVKGPVDE